MHLIPGQHIHLVGIGGYGLSAIARVLLQQGFHISGSDRQENALTRALARDGADIHYGHDPAHIRGAEMLIVSSAVSFDLPEVAAAHALGIPVYKRSDVIAAVMSGHHGIAIAGTHGKTTTTAMTAHILIETGKRPSYIVGGILRTTGQNAGVDTGRIFVIEADEYDNMFLGLRPQTEVITNVEWDHPDFFATPHDLIRSFSHFVGLLPESGLLIACADDPAALIFAENRMVVDLPVETYGIANSQATWRAINLGVDSRRLPIFDVTHRGNLLGTVQLSVPGNHNVLNALAAIIVAHSQGVPFAYAAEALRSFEGTGRRFDVRGEAGGVVVIDDYAHHPTAIRVTLDAARQRYPDHQLWALWQPHTYSRTRSLLDAYAGAFTAADHVLVTDIFAAREAPVSGINGETVVNAIIHADVRHTPTFEDAAALLAAEVTAPAVILIMSAGDAPRIGELFLARRGG